MRALSESVAVLLGCAPILVGLCAQPQELTGQTIRGRTIDATAGDPIHRVEVAMRAGGDVVQRVWSDSSGAFVLAVPSAGRYVLRARLIGYVTLDSVEVEVGPAELIELTLRMSATAISLEPISVTARRADPRHLATYEGFYARQKLARPIGNSRVVLRDDPEMVGAMKISEVLNWFPRGRCMQTYLNGLPRRYAEVMDIPVSLLAGLEYYKNAIDAPMSLASRSSVCSVLAVWLRREG